MEAVTTRRRLARWVGLLLFASRAAGSEPDVDARAAAPSARAADRATATAAPFAPGEEIDLTLDYLHVRAGRVKLVLGRPEGAVWPVICQARTDGAATLLDIREHFVSYWDAETHTSRGS